MTVDHLTWVFFPGYNTAWYALALHLFGRITAPTMWFFVAEGYYHTRNVKKYDARLFILSVISHFAYCFLFRHPLIPFRQSMFDQTSVIWSLAWGLLLLIVNGSKKVEYLAENSDRLCSVCHYILFRLELHRSNLHFIYRCKSRQFQKTNDVADDMDCRICRSIYGFS